VELGTFAAIYFVVWWLCLFVVLPFRVRNQVDHGEWQAGTDPGAPAGAFRIWPKLLVTTLIALIITPLVLWAIDASGVVEYWR
jgi:predicted secreted protein